MPFIKIECRPFIIAYSNLLKFGHSFLMGEQPFVYCARYFETNFDGSECRLVTRPLLQSNNDYSSERDIY